jgi:hypothetical protein
VGAMWETKEFGGEALPALCGLFRGRGKLAAWVASPPACEAPWLKGAPLSIPRVLQRGAHCDLHCHTCAGLSPSHPDCAPSAPTP